MVIISKPILRMFIERHPDSAVPLNDWYIKTKAVDWGEFKDVKHTFNSVDSVGNDRYVFNISGNKYRLVAMIFFSVRTVYIKFIGSHSEYDKIDVKTIDIKS